MGPKNRQKYLRGAIPSLPSSLDQDLKEIMCQLLAHGKLLKTRYKKEKNEHSLAAAELREAEAREDVVREPPTKRARIAAGKALMNFDSDGDDSDSDDSMVLNATQLEKFRRAELNAKTRMENTYTHLQVLSDIATERDGYRHKLLRYILENPDNLSLLQQEVRREPPHGGPFVWQVTSSDARLWQHISRSHWRSKAGGNAYKSRDLLFVKALWSELGQDPKLSKYEPNTDSAQYALILATFQHLRRIRRLLQWAYPGAPQKYSEAKYILTKRVNRVGKDVAPLMWLSAILHDICDHYFKYHMRRAMLSVEMRWGGHKSSMSRKHAEKNFRYRYRMGPGGTYLLRIMHSMRIAGIGAEEVELLRMNMLHLSSEFGVEHWKTQNMRRWFVKHIHWTQAEMVAAASKKKREAEAGAAGAAGAAR